MNLAALTLRIIRIILKACAIFILLLAVFITFQYSRTAFYNFPETKAFEGKEFYNPYQSVSAENQTLKANFHAHGKSWGALTNGEDEDHHIHDAYKKYGYDIIGISNYHSLSEFDKENESYIPVYEHGVNPLKTHCLVLNPKQVSYFDIPFFQTISMQQHVIEKIKEHGGLVAIAHPELSGRSLEGMRNLVHYDFTEVLNHYRVSDKFWDEALSNGKLSWILSNDDTHGINEGTAFKIWNAIYSESRNKDSILENMKLGLHYGVKTESGFCNKKLDYCRIQDNKLLVKFSEPINLIEVIGQDGTILDSQYATDQLVYNFKDSDTYIRIEAHDHHFSFYLNPIVRYDGKNVPYNTDLKLSQNQFRTWTFRIAMYLLILLEFYLIIRIVKKKKRA